MRTFSTGAIVAICLAAQVSAGLLTSDPSDSRLECGSKRARMVVDVSEDGIVFPDDNARCREINDDSMGDQKNEFLKPDSSDGGAAAERLSIVPS